ncbi:hypothetical protein [Thiocapsa rosea]|uniref:Uncharacterized protein n=1 Tax=Thiocapsa rosea TaxID=69360 RepID=A0A495VES6_9GAMM|nr:hypothetical protein [Thiocapsa rosea]RKT47340.1 hypothetical protein BDD21_4907 [Thiocapsa rosea]
MTESTTTRLPKTHPNPEGPVTLYYEIRVPNPEQAKVIDKIDALIAFMQGKTGYLSLSLKQMTGESTMVKNYPEHLKGVLAEGYIDNPKVPGVYSLLVRFADLEALESSGIQSWFEENIAPSLFAYSGTTKPPTKTGIALEVFKGVFITVAAGDRSAIYTTPHEIRHFLAHPSDEVGNASVTVENHVMINDRQVAQFNEKVKVLLSIAQETCRPDVNDADYDDAYPDGREGSKDNHHYRKAVTTEILQNAYPDGDLRAYLMHGVWESVYDHENSHIDPRFQQAAGPVGASVVSGPVEPFYRTIKQG